MPLITAESLQHSLSACVLKRELPSALVLDSDLSGPVPRLPGLTHDHNKASPLADMATAIVCAPSSDFQTPSSGYSYTRHSRPNRGELTSFAWSLHLPLPRPTPPHKRRKVGPLSSFRLFDELPVELVERVLRNLDLEDLGRLGRVNRSVRHVCPTGAWLPG